MSLRLLAALPQFLDGLLGKLILELRLKLSGLTSTLQAFIGGGSKQATQRAAAINTALSKIGTVHSFIA
jgi:hypothetical protein